MARRPLCTFCDEIETQHLLFLCPVSRIIWRVAGSMLGTECCPNSIWQYYVWMAFLPGFDKLYTVGLAAICWAIWLARNRATFEPKWINSHFEVVFTACTFLIYWAGLQKPDMVQVVRKGAELLKMKASQMMLLCRPPQTDTMKLENSDDLPEVAEFWRVRWAFFLMMIKTWCLSLFLAGLVVYVDTLRCCSFTSSFMWVSFVLDSCNIAVLWWVFS